MTVRIKHRGSILPLNIEIETGDPLDNGTRHAAILLGGITLFEDFVGDTDPSGWRTPSWANQGILLLFRDRLKAALERDPYEEERNG